MCDSNDENPYASPEGAAQPAVPVIHGIWRDGDEMVVAPSHVKAPKACWVTNRTRFVSRTRIGSAPVVRSVFVLLAPITLILTSPLGFLVLLVIWSGLSMTGGIREGRTYAWLSVGATLRSIAAGLVNDAWIVAILILFVLGLNSANLVMALVAVPASVLSIVSMFCANRILLGLHVVHGENHTIRIRGVHPDYLARLPAYNESDITSAMTIEPGESPFGDPAS